MSGQIPRVGVIGLGSMGANHARVLAELETADLVAVCDVDPQRLRAATRGRTVRGYEAHVPMLEAEALDALVVAVPTTLHFDIVAQALERRIAVLVEKPVAATVAQGYQLADLAAAKGVLLSVGHIERFNPAVQELRRRMQDGLLGPVFRIHARRVGPFSARIRDVGVTLDLATHDIDVIRYLTGSDVASAYAVTARQVHTEHEDMLSGILHLESGVAALLDVNWLTPAKIRELAVLGERGMFLADYLTQDLLFYENDAASRAGRSPLTLAGVTEGPMTRIPIEKQEPLRAELEAFLRALSAGGPPPVPAADGARAVAIAEALLESSERGAAVSCDAGSPTPA